MNRIINKYLQLEEGLAQTKRDGKLDYCSRSDIQYIAALLLIADAINTIDEVTVYPRRLEDGPV